MADVGDKYVKVVILPDGTNPIAFLGDAGRANVTVGGR